MTVLLMTGGQSFAQNKHQYVDLGLPSGTLWATCNIGANYPWECGNYYAWGETKKKTNYEWKTYKYCNYSKKGVNLTKYCNKSDHGNNGFTDELTKLQPGDDVATTNWGSSWRTPTEAEWNELRDNTTVTETTQGGVNGRLFTASNGNSLFLPVADYRRDDELSDVGSYGYYWSSSLGTDSPDDVWSLRFYSDGCYLGDLDRRGDGQSVRAVRSARQN